MDFVLNRIPRTDFDIFVDASTSWGAGGCCGRYFFATPWTELEEIPAEFIAQKELLACLLALFCFGHLFKGKYVKLHTDNDNTYHWLRKGRSVNETGTKFLAIWEFGKYLLECKVSPRWIPSEKNVTADSLSRGTVPEWLQRRGCERIVSQGVKKILSLSPIETWKRINQLKEVEL